MKRPAFTDKAADAIQAVISEASGSIAGTEDSAFHRRVNFGVDWLQRLLESREFKKQRKNGDST